MKKATNLPTRMPTKIEVVAHADMARDIKGKFVPRAPKDGELCLRLNRPQAGPDYFVEFASGDLIGIDTRYVVIAAKPGYSRKGEGWIRREQIVIARVATAEDAAAVAPQAAKQDSVSREVLRNAAIN